MSEPQVSPPGAKTKPFSLMNLKVGPIPLPLYLILAAVIYAASYYNKLPTDMIGGFAVVMVMGVLLGDVGLRIPILKDIGGPAILSIFIPSVMVFYNMINPASLKSITSFMKVSNFIYFYISCLITGSILGMQRVILVQGFLRMFVPLFVGTVASVIVGTIVGTICGMGWDKSFFYVVVPILSGGVGEGVLPLSLAYAELTNMPYDKLIPMLIPAATLGNVVAIMCAGYLRKLGEKKPQYDGGGLLVKSGDEEFLRVAQTTEKPVDFPVMGAGLLMAMTFFLLGQVASLFIPFPAPIIMIFTAAAVKALNIMPPLMEQGAYHMYRFAASSLTWPLLIGVGVVYTPWRDVMVALTPAYIATVVATVVTMVASGFFIARYVNMYPIEAAIVTGCHSGLGGTGDVAILSASNRMQLMPFAQVSTRLGGACMVVIAAILMKIYL